MTRALAIALTFAATLAAIVVGFLVFLPGGPAHRRAAPAVVERLPAVERVLVLAGQTAERAVVMKERYADQKRIEFTDRALAEALGAAAPRRRFVEVWVVNQGEADLKSLEAAPSVRGRHGAPVSLERLNDLFPAAGAPNPRADMFVKALAPDPSQPLRKGSFRRTVYAMPAGVAFQDLESAEVDGIRLAPREATEDALEAFLERPRPDLIAALAKPEDAPASRAGSAAMTEDSR